MLRHILPLLLVYLTLALEVRASHVPDFSLKGKRNLIAARNRIHEDGARTNCAPPLTHMVLDWLHS